MLCASRKTCRHTGELTNPGFYAVGNMIQHWLLAANFTYPRSEPLRLLRRRGAGEGAASSVPRPELLAARLDPILGGEPRGETRRSRPSQKAAGLLRSPGGL